MLGYTESVIEPVAAVYQCFLSTSWITLCYQAAGPEWSYSSSIDYLSSMYSIYETGNSISKGVEKRWSVIGQITQYYLT